MTRPRATSIVIDAFYDNFTCAALFRKIRIPGSPKEVVDPRSAHEFWADEFQHILGDLKTAFHMMTGVALVGAIFKGFAERRTRKKEQLEAFLASWSSSSKQ